MGLHFHSYREGYEDRWAEQLDPFEDLRGALADFCKRVNEHYSKLV
jgi:hypothetical protein